MIAETCAELGCKISFGSDAHIATRIADARSVIKLLEEVDFPEELMACRDAQTFWVPLLTQRFQLLSRDTKSDTSTATKASRCSNGRSSQQHCIKKQSRVSARL